MIFTPDELAALAAFDAETEKAPLTDEEIQASSERDRAVRLERKTQSKRKIAEYRTRYYEAHKAEILAYKKAWRKANRERINAYKRAYYKANPARYEAHKKTVREYYRRKKEEADGHDAADESVSGRAGVCGER